MKKETQAQLGKELLKQLNTRSTKERRKILQALEILIKGGRTFIHVSVADIEIFANYDLFETQATVLRDGKKVSVECTEDVERLMAEMRSGYQIRWEVELPTE